jgi:hypothetical protein
LEDGDVLDADAEGGGDGWTAAMDLGVARGGRRGEERREEGEGNGFEMI